MIPSLEQNFDINDLSQISGVKKHTIRIWEKRYKSFIPERTNKNIRIYKIQHLQKILNIVFLINSGYNILRISKLSEEEFLRLVLNVSGNNSTEIRAINNFKIAVINLNQQLFHETYNYLEEKWTFSQIFKNVFSPLIGEIQGLQKKNIINSVQKQFFEDLLKKKLYCKIALLDNIESLKKELYVLFTLEYERDEILLLFLKYELKVRKSRTFLFSEKNSIEFLQYFISVYKNPVSIIFLNAAPNEIEKFLNKIEREFYKDAYQQFIILGETDLSFGNIKCDSKVKIFNSINEFIFNLSLNSTK